MDVGPWDKLLPEPKRALELRFTSPNGNKLRLAVMTHPVLLVEQVLMTNSN